MKPYRKECRILPKEWRNQWSFVPAGEAIYEGQKTSTDPFFIATYEVSNRQYNVFLNERKAENMANEKWEVDTSAWTKAIPALALYATYYNTHNAYSDYPAVCVSYDGALAYCQWQQQKMEDALGTDYIVTCTLPSRAEWIRAARGDQHSFVYAWGGPKLSNLQGCGLCNYSCIGEESVSIPIGQKQATVHPQATMGVAGMLSDNADILAVVHAYSPGVYGCYNMNGNAAEMLLNGQMAAGGSWRNSGYDVRTESLISIDGPAAHVGFRPLLRIEHIQKTTSN